MVSPSPRLTTAAFAAAGLAFVAMAPSGAAATDLKASRTEFHLMGCTLAATVPGDCDIVTYMGGVAFTAFNPVIILMCMVIWYPFFCCCRWCCNICGGKVQSPDGYCCAVTKPIKYTFFDILRAKVFTWGLLAGFAFGFIYGFTGSAKITVGTIDLLDGVEAVPVVLRHEINLIVDALYYDIYSAETGLTTRGNFMLDSPTGRATYKAANDSLNSIQDTLDGAFSGAKDQLTTYNWIPFVIFAIPGIFPILGAVFACCNIREWCPMCMLHFMCIFGGLVWFIQMIVAFLSVLTVDLCYEIDSLADQRLNIIVPLTGCNNSMFSDFRTNFHKMEILQAEAVCTGLKATCWDKDKTLPENLAAGRALTCPNMDTTCPGISFDRLLEVLDNEIYTEHDIATAHGDIVTANPKINELRCSRMDWRSRCTTARCATNCLKNDKKTLSGIGKSSKQAYVGLSAANQITHVVDTIAARYSQCDSVYSIIFSPLATGCSELAVGTDMVRTAFGLYGVCLISGMIVMAWGSKRFIPFGYAGKTLVNGEPIDEEDATNRGPQNNNSNWNNNNNGNCAGALALGQPHDPNLAPRPADGVPFHSGPDHERSPKISPEDTDGAIEYTEGVADENAFSAQCGPAPTSPAGANDEEMNEANSHPLVVSDGDNGGNNNQPEQQDSASEQQQEDAPPVQQDTEQQQEDAPPVQQDTEQQQEDAPPVQQDAQEDAPPVQQDAQEDVQQDS